MKKLIFLFTLAAFMFSSCNNDDDSKGGHVSFKAFSDVKHYNNPIISLTEPNPENGEVLRRLRAGSTDADAIDFEIGLTETGNTTPQFFAYMTQHGTYYPLDDSFSFTIESNANGHLKGTFSGILLRENSNDEMPEIIEIFDGNFDVRY